MALKLKQVYIYQFTTFSLLNKEENKLVDEIKMYKKEERQTATDKFNKEVNKFKGQRSIRKTAIDKSIENFLKNDDSNLVSLFESDISQWIEKNKPENIQPLGNNKVLLKGIVFLKVFHNNIMQQIIDNGLLIDDVEYCVYTAAAGQQRKSKLTLIEKSIMNDFISKKYMCGLTVDKINKTGGINSGKYLAYMSLPLSSSKPINIDINKVIVVDDMELMVNKSVEYIDNDTFKHEIINMPDPLNMTDGAGMILPDAMKEIEKQLELNYPLTGFQLRSSWIKGAVFSFNFKQFCQEENKYIVRDIWNKDHDIVKEDIQMILTRSQLKTYGKYNNWKEYKEEFINQGLSFSVTAVNNADKNNMQMAYQFLQTLNRDKADDEHIKALCEKSIKHFKMLHDDTNTILQQFGACDGNEMKEPFQEALMLYPALLNDPWVKQKLEKMVSGYKKDLLCAKLETDGFYGYAQPDMYAFCEWLFLGEQEPTGLIPDNYIYCRYYHDQDINKVDCLRSPHLNNEHTIRNISHSEECKKWFEHCGQNVIYSIHDYLMLCVQGDVDGDTLAIVPNITLIDMVKPHEVLFYRMFKAPAQQINEKTIYNTLVNSFECNREGQSIGYISNAISKCWNQDELNDDTLNLIKYLTMKSNFTIDFPKTQKNIDLPKDIQAKYELISQSQFPYFFKYIKGKKTVAEPNDSVMDRIIQHIETQTKGGLRYKYKADDFDYSMLQSRNDDGKVDVDRSEKEYTELKRFCYQYGSKVQFLSKKLKSVQNSEDTEDEQDKVDVKFDLVYSLCLMDMLKLYPDKCILANALVDLCYCQPYSIPGINNIMWKCCGDIIVHNIAENKYNIDYISKTRTRMAYKKKDIEQVEMIKSKLDILLEGQKPVIYQHDVDAMQSIKIDKNKQIYYVLLCLCKLFENSKEKLNHKVYIANGKKSKINNSKILKMAGLSSTTTISAALKKLKEMNLINIEAPKSKGGKIISLVDYDFDVTEDEIIFTVNNAWNPIIYYRAYFEHKKIGKCVICGRDILKEGNKKTCSQKCSDMLKKETKENNYEKSKNCIDLGIVS